MFTLGIPEPDTLDKPELNLKQDPRSKVSEAPGFQLERCFFWPQGAVSASYLHGLLSWCSPQTVSQVR